MTNDDFSWVNLEEVAETFCDLKRVHNVRSELKDALNPIGHSFEALAAFKAKCDEKDRC